MGSNNTLLEMRNIVKPFSGARTLDGVSLAARPGECASLCGENGAGKSTLMKMPSGVYPYGAFEGEILWEGEPLRTHSMRGSEHAGIVVIHQELMMVQQLSVMKNVFLDNETTKPGGRIDYDTIHAKAEEFLARLRLTDVNVVTPVINYSSGHRQSFEIAETLVKNVRLLILDGPTSSLPAREIKVLLLIIDDPKRSGVAYVCISHKFDEIKHVCDTVTIARDGKHIDTRPAADMTADNIIAMMVGREMTSLFPKAEHTVSDVMTETRNVTCWDVINPNRKRTNNVNFAVCHGETLGMAGFVGVGRTEMVPVLSGAHPGHSGTETVMDGRPAKVTSSADVITTGICLVPKDRKRHGIVSLMAVDENITPATLAQYARGLRVGKGARLTTIDREIKYLHTKTANPALVIASFSGSNQQKAMVTKMVLAVPKVPILDEPTHGVDVGSKYDTYKMIADLTASGVAVIMVSSEISGILGMSDRIPVMDEDQLRGDFVDQGLAQERILAAVINAEPGRQAA